MDEDVMMAYLEGEEPDVATLKRLIRKGTISGAFVPGQRARPPSRARLARSLCLAGARDASAAV
jgi:hypothetical protein